MKRGWAPGCSSFPVCISLLCLQTLLEHLAGGPVLRECVEQLYQFAGAAVTKYHSPVA